MFRRAQVIARIVVETLKRSPPRLGGTTSSRSRQQDQNDANSAWRVKQLPAYLWFLQKILSVAGPRACRVISAPRVRMHSRVVLARIAATTVIGSIIANCEEQSNEDFKLLCSGWIYSGCGQRDAPSPLWNQNRAIKKKRNPYADLSDLARFRVSRFELTRRYAILPAVHNLDNIHHFLADIPTRVILAAFNASEDMVRAILENEERLSALVTRVKLLAWASSVGMKIIVLTGIWNEATQFLNQIMQKPIGGVDAVVPLYALILARAAPADMEAHTEYIQKKLEQLGEADKSERAVVLTHTLYVMGALGLLCKSSIKVQSVARAFLARRRIASACRASL